MFLHVFFCFLFKQKTAYEMRISDWSSDVCSSDLRYRNRVSSPFSPITSALLPVYAAFVRLNPSAAQVNGAIDDISGVFENSSGQAFDPAGVAAILDNRLQNISLQSLSGMDAAVKYSHDFGDSGKIQINGTVR